jgi:spermidine/putrescine transport system permease protein
VQGDQQKDLALLTATVAAQPGGEPPKRADQFLAKRRQRVAYGLLAPGAIYLAFAFIVPLILIVYTSLESGGLLSGGYEFSWAFENYSSVFNEYRGFYAKSLVYSGLATLFCILLAYPMAYWIAFYGGKWKSTLFFMILVPFFVSFVIRTVQWKFLLADDGVLFGPLKSIGLLPDDFQVLATPIAVVAGITYNFLPFTALPLYVALERIDKRLVEAAKDLYASKWEAFRKVVLPLSFPGLFAALILTFVPATGDYVNSSVLGSNKTTMIGQIIQSKFLTEADYPEAAALSVILMVGMLVIALIYARALGTEDAALAAGAV